MRGTCFFISRMESEVGDLMGKEGKELEAQMGRACGPEFVQRCAMGMRLEERGERRRLPVPGGSPLDGSATS